MGFEDFDTYYEIFVAKHKDDKNFPLLMSYDMTTEQSVRTLREYFDDFWEAARETVVTNEIASLKFEIAELEGEINQLESKIDDLEEECDEKDVRIYELQKKVSQNE